MFCSSRRMLQPRILPGCRDQFKEERRSGLIVLDQLRQNDSRIGIAANYGDQI